MGHISVSIQKLLGVSDRSQDVLRLSFEGSRCSTEQSISLDEAERLYYKLRWALQALQDYGRVPLPLRPFLWKLCVTLTPTDSRRGKPRRATYYVLANTEDDVRKDLLPITRSYNGVLLGDIEITKAPLEGRTFRVSLVVDKKPAHKS